MQILCSKPNNSFIGALTSDATQLKCSLKQTAQEIPPFHFDRTSPLNALYSYTISEIFYISKLGQPYSEAG